MTCSMQSGTWKLFFYMDASDGLTDMAIKNITDIMRGKAGDSNDNVDVVIQLHAYNQVALRYYVTSNGMSFVEEATLTADCKKDFIDAATWAFEHNNADHTMIIFSNHGYGALDPQWDSTTKSWQVTGLNMSNNANETCSVPKNGEFIDLLKCHKNHKGFMFNAQSNTYLKNHELADGLAYMQNNILHQKIDIVAFDTCMGSMLEVATCVAPYAHYLLGVQSCALRDGFDYQGFMSVLHQGNCARQTVTQLVDRFNTYYAEHDESGIYTCAALDMTYVDPVNKAVNTIVAKILEHPEFLPLLGEARKKTHRFCLWPIYTDLVAFLKLFENQLLALSASEITDTLVKDMHALYDMAQTMVVARCGGTTTIGHAYGFSIYVPPQTMEASYLDSIFALNCQWPMLMSKLYTA